MLRSRIALLIFGFLIATLLPLDASAQIVRIAPVRTSTECQNPCPRHAVVFVHGIWGSADTWRNTQSGNDWPELLRDDQAFKDFDIYRLDYDTAFTQKGPDAETLTNAMTVALEPLLARNYLSTQFIAHSLGGLLVRDYFLHLKSTSAHKKLSKIRLVLLMASPGQGSKWASIARLFSSSSTLRILRSIDENDWAQLINAMTFNITRKHEDFGCPSLRFYGAYEEETTMGALVVSKESASSNVFQSERPVRSPQGFARDHAGIVKPRDANDEVYRWAKKLMLDCASAGESCPKPKDQLPTDCYFEVPLNQ